MTEKKQDRWKFDAIQEPISSYVHIYREGSHIQVSVSGPGKCEDEIRLIAARIAEFLNNEHLFAKKTTT